MHIQPILFALILISSSIVSAMDIETVTISQESAKIQALADKPMPPKQRLFMTSINLGRVSVVHELLKTGEVEVNTVFKGQKKHFSSFSINNRLPLNLALKNDHLEIVALLLAHNADPKMYSGSEHNALRTCINGMITSVYNPHIDWNQTISIQTSLLKLLATFNASMTEPQGNDQSTVLHDLASALGRNDESLFIQRILTVLRTVLTTFDDHYEALAECHRGADGKRNPNIKKAWQQQVVAACLSKNYKDKNVLDLACNKGCASGQHNNTKCAGGVACNSIAFTNELKCYGIQEF